MRSQLAKHPGRQLTHWRDGLRRPSHAAAVILVRVHSAADHIFRFLKDLCTRSFMQHYQVPSAQYSGYINHVISLGLAT